MTCNCTGECCCAAQPYAGESGGSPSGGGHGSGKAPDSCYWSSGGRCTLNTLPPEWVFNFLAHSPQAREDLLRCYDMNRLICGEFDARYVSNARKGVKVIESQEASDNWQRDRNRFVDNHLHIQQGTVFRENPSPTKDGGDDDE